MSDETHHKHIVKDIHSNVMGRRSLNIYFCHAQDQKQNIGVITDITGVFQPAAISHSFGASEVQVV